MPQGILYEIKLKEKIKKAPFPATSQEESVFFFFFLSIEFLYKSGTVKNEFSDLLAKVQFILSMVSYNLEGNERQLERFAIS